jgi:putative PIN family toxin of toxin-antitoxin system
MIRVVLDTNVLVAAAISPTGPNAQVLDLIVADKIRPYVTAAVVQEYDRVFGYERLQHLDKRHVANVRRLLKAAAVKVKPRGRLTLSEHEDDNRIYDAQPQPRPTTSSLKTPSTSKNPSPTPKSSPPANCSSW